MAGSAVHNERIAALAAKRQALNAKAKLLGLITDKQEVRGSITNLNINDPTAEEIAEFTRAARNAVADASEIVRVLQA